MVVERTELVFEAGSDEMSACVLLESPKRPPTAHLAVDGNKDKLEEAKKYFTLKIYKSFQISIFKPLILLKLALFFWFGGGSSHLPFIIVYLKQLGITISEISFMYMLSPVAQMLTGILSGIIADKTGRPKAVLVANILIVIITLSCLLFLPSMKEADCLSVQVNVRCSGQELNTPIANCIGVSISNATSEAKLCTDLCQTKITVYDDSHNFKCDFRGGKQSHENSTHVYALCSDEMIVRENNTWKCICELVSKNQCWITCESYEDSTCASGAESRIILLVLASTVVILFLTSHSVCFSFLDVTAMCLIQRHGKDFGRQRVSSIMGQLVFSSFTGFIIQATTSEGEADNYVAAFYITIILTLGAMLSVLGLEVHLSPPGKKMWRNSLILFKNPDAVAFFLILYVFGTCYTFTNHYIALYLKELNASSILLGIMMSIGGVYGIPFLYTSNWWINKIGHTNLFLMALLGYAVQCIVCSAVRNPWWILALEMTDIVTYHLLWVAVITYSDFLATDGLKATVIALAGIIHHGIGRSSASLIGGQVMAAYGGRTAFRVLGYVCSASAFLYLAYLVMNRIYRGQKRKPPKQEKKKGQRQCNENIKFEVVKNHLPTAMEMNSFVC